MSIEQDIYAAVQNVSNQESFIQNLLVGALNWEVDPDATAIEDTAYEYTADELKSPLLDEKCNGRALQLSFKNQIPWGVFLIEFAHAEPFVQSRGLTMPLRQIINALVPKQRRDSDLPAWKQENLLFICTHNYKHFRFAYFKAPKDKERTSPLAQFGWNADATAIRTLCENNLPHLQWDNCGKWHEAFSIEKVTKDFYKAYADVFFKAEDAIAAANGLDKTKPDQKETLRMYTQLLFNRLMFLRFIEKKGWLNFKGKPDGYLAELFKASKSNSESFFKSRLVPLFFEGLAVEGKQEFPAIGKVPFLNGGLFERSEKLDDIITDIPDDVFEPILALPTDTYEAGLFYRFNFTVEESTPLDIEVAVDPEMLGKVFEELVTGRHESGSYYTPRAIVSFMCREAIKAYLTEKTSAKLQAIELLVDEHTILKNSLNDQQAGEILYCLRMVKACDPACGSGAYLLGLMQELIAIRQALRNQAIRQDAQSLYTLKLTIISDNLYGVDIDEFATNIAKLRLWLSLAVEAEEPTPLPNLDFKIETGDSLLGPVTQKGQQLSFDMALLEKWSKELIAAKYEYMVAHGKEKTKLLELIKNREEAIAEKCHLAFGPKVITWPVHFAEVFFAEPEKQETTFKGEFVFMVDVFKQKAFKQTIEAKTGGFDIVLANPPYVRMELFKEIKPQLRSLYPSIHSGRSDLYCYFYARAVQMLSQGGVLAFISPNKFFRANYGKNLRKYLTDETNILSITDFGDSPIFEATAYPMIFIAQKGKNGKPTIFTDTRVESGNIDVIEIVKREGQTLAEKALLGGDWSFANNQTSAKIEKMKAAGVPLKEYVNGEIYYGIKTGCNEAFVIDSKTRDELISEDPASKELIKPLLMGRDIKRWSYQNREQWLIYIPKSQIKANDFPAIQKHLEQYKEKLKSRATQQEWFELQQAQFRYAAAFEKPKIVFPDIAPQTRFAFDTQGHFLGNTGYVIPVDDKFLLGVLNSDIVNEFYTDISAQVRGGYLRFIFQYVAEIPIPKASEKDKAVISTLVQKCLDAEGQGCEKWEAEINERVAKLYGLDS